MDRYQRVEKPKAGTPINENEIRITTQGRMRNYITYATTLLQEKGSDEIALKAMGRAINKTVMIAELIKVVQVFIIISFPFQRRIVGLHQNTAIGSTDITDMWEPLEEGLLPLETTRHVSVVTVTLSKKELDTSSTGYYPSAGINCLFQQSRSNHGLDMMMMEVKASIFEGSPNMAGKGRGGQGRGRGGIIYNNLSCLYIVNNSNGVLESNGDGGWDGGRYAGRGRGRGRSRNFRGRGRGYGGGNMRQGSGGYYNDYGGGFAPAQGRAVTEFYVGRGRGRGRARGRGRGQGFRSDGPIPAAA
ncbi:hypothetical protein Patl1_08019 [Pistacia atlantica]|uniref:Uncharacterized protein n=1 Tax=Pistacia atlantica TaxID=434234 RepID=A0ACC1AJB5_9ROSI|nr:hypothetical protein Patl1_08019 [Pistacia atlantica]